MTCYERWQIVLTRFAPSKPTCERCGAEDAPYGDGRKRGSLDVHHKIPRRFGGKDTPDNWSVLCKSCHKKADADFLARAAKFYVKNGGR
jgi:5-methylcytosine-specific restriction endonuclease McrA